jgi:hypothetical protein
MSPKEVMGDIHQKARKRLEKDVRAMLLHCANVGRLSRRAHCAEVLPGVAWRPRELLMHATRQAY